MSNMWLYTPDGFFSPKYDDFCNKNEVMIRGRYRQDLVKLTKVLGMDDYEIVELPKADYRFRMKVDKNEWATYCMVCALDDRPTEVTGGVKNVTKKEIDFRYLTYLSIWYIMKLFQDYSVAEEKGDIKEMVALDEILFGKILLELMNNNEGEEYNSKEIENEFDVEFMETAV